MYAYLIDIVGTCNLRCPSCPVGNMKEADFKESPRKKGFMKLDLFESVIEKIVAENSAINRQFQVHLYNWGEPMIHPEFDEICRILARHKIWFHVSSNMNHEASFAQLVRTAGGIRASTSGFTNETYQRGHVGGDINLFISNLYRLRYTMDKMKSNPIVQIYYHVYKDNCDDNMKKLADLCETLGFAFSPAYAYFMGFEKYLYYFENSPKFGEKDRAIADKMLFSIDDALEIAKYGRQTDCSLRQEQTVINHDGSVALCCTVFDPVHNVADDFLAISADDLKARKMAATTCETCMSHNFHNMAVYDPPEIFEEIAVMRLLENKQKYIARAFTRPHIAEARYDDAEPGAAE